jgi:Holliday junction resolvase RusA-like endonuclease
VNLIDVVIPGDAKGQGSMTLWRAPDGSERAKHAPATVVYRNAVAEALSGAWGENEALWAPVLVVLDVTLSRPLGHYGTGRNQGTVKASAPDWHDKYPDLDKVCRLYGDALVIAGVLRDDRQVAGWQATKRYGPKGMTRCRVVAL